MAITGKNIKNFKTMKNIGRGKEVEGNPWLPDPDPDLQSSVQWPP